jgi:hypothetical protein
MAYFDAELPTDELGQLLPEAVALRAAIVQLCDPDPSRRGHPLNVAAKSDQYAVNRYITQFDNTAKRMRVHERKV